jgi:GT2 family glycosyltransferase
MTSDVSKPPPESRFGMLIPNWNGEAFIQPCLEAVSVAVRESGHEIPCLVIDDASADRSPGMIERSFPEIQLIRQSPNRGFGATVNRGMNELRCEWVFLLNNDLAPRPDFCARLIETLEKCGEERVFAIGARTVEWDSDETNHGGQRALWRRGMIAQVPFETDSREETGFFQAGACLIHRERFLSLGGFADIFHPGYWEDYDLAWQARRRGWINVYDGLAIGNHVGQGSMRRLLGDRRLANTQRRNRLLFNWVELTDPTLLLLHILSLPMRIVPGMFRFGRVGWGIPFLTALQRLPAVIRLRRGRRGSETVCNDRQLLVPPPSPIARREGDS